MGTRAAVPAPGDSLAQLRSPSGPCPASVALAAAVLPRVTEPAGPADVQTEGPRWEIVIAPGAIQVRTVDWARASRHRERAAQRHSRDVDLLAGWLSGRGEFPGPPGRSREITGWSPKSRRHMVLTLCQLDYGPLFADRTRLPAMITLTYPGDWLSVAPHGSAVKAHLKALRKRYQRAWHEDLPCVWKLEFQRRGAPHLHLLVVPPHGLSGEGQSFPQWLSRAWAQVVAHPDPDQYRSHLLAGTAIDWTEGLRATDPKRVAVYFTKHGAASAKEYQHCVPEPWQAPGHGPGRFWGYWALRPVRAGVWVLPAEGITAGRILRRWARAQGTTRQTTRKRIEQATGRVRFRTSRIRVRRLPGNAGWVSVSNGPRFATELARALTTLR